MKTGAILTFPLIIGGGYLLDRMTAVLPHLLVAIIGASAVTALAVWLLRDPHLRVGIWSTCPTCALPLDALGNPAANQHTSTPCPSHGLLTLPS